MTGAGGGGGFDSPGGLGDIDAALDATKREEADSDSFQPFFEDSDATVAAGTWGEDRNVGIDVDSMGIGSHI